MDIIIDNSEKLETKYVKLPEIINNAKNKPEESIVMNSYLSLKKNICLTSMMLGMM